MFRKAFNKIQNNGSNRDFGTTKAAKMYFSMSEPSPADSPFPKTDVKPVSFMIIEHFTTDEEYINSFKYVKGRLKI